MKPVSIVIPAYIRQHQMFKMTHECLSGISKSHHINNCEVILVDDGSDQKWIDLLKKVHSSVKFIHNAENMGFAEAVNKGIRNSTMDMVLLLNNDVQILQLDWLVRFVNGADELGFDIASPKQSMLDERFQYINDIDRHKHKAEKCFCYAVGWALLVNKQVFREVGLMPTNFGRGFWEDVAWFYKVKQHPKFKTGIVEGIDRIKLLHLEHQTFRAEAIDLKQQYDTNRAIFLEVLKGKRSLTLPRLDDV